jgi:hypothetical protein
MANSERGNQCMHDGCSCDVQEGQTYCSPACERADNETQATSAGRCSCGHPGCEGNH